jgi:hypothetical protein
MALITCPKCGHQVADTETSCPDCGSDITQVIIKRSVRKANIFVTVLVVIVFSIVMFTVYQWSKGSQDMFRNIHQTEVAIVLLIESLVGVSESEVK